MSLIRKRTCGRWGLAIVAGAALCAGAGGCQNTQLATAPEPLITHITPDPAMQKRNFSIVEAQYTNTTVMTGVDGFRREPKPDLPQYDYYLIDPFTFVYDTLTIFYTGAKTLPGTDVPNRAQTYPPTYTGAQPLTPF
jgi:hypothetical protein